MLEVRLARDGHEVILATTGDDALRAASDEQPDVALLDQTPDDVSSFDVLSALQGKSQQFEGILMSIDATTDFVVKAMNIGAYDVIPKPIADLKIVLHKVKKALAKVLAERDRHELARLLHAQTQDIARREVLAVQHGADQPEEDEPTALDLDNMSGVDPLTGLPNRHPDAPVGEDQSADRRPTCCRDRPGGLRLLPVAPRRVEPRALRGGRCPCVCA